MTFYPKQPVCIAHNEMYNDCISNPNAIEKLSSSILHCPTLRGLSKNNVLSKKSMPKQVCLSSLTSKRHGVCQCKSIFKTFPVVFVACLTFTSSRRTFSNNGLIIKQLMIHLFLNLFIDIDPVEKDNKNCST